MAKEENQALPSIEKACGGPAAGVLITTPARFKLAAQRLGIYRPFTQHFSSNYTKRFTL
jgi:hypothetical protein